MKVKVLEDAPGSPDGVTVIEYEKGETYEVTDALGAAFVDHGLAVAVEDAPAPAPRRNKKSAGSSENK